MPSSSPVPKPSLMRQIGPYLGVFLLWGTMGLSLSHNVLGVAPQRHFLTFQRDGESFVVGRMLQSRAEGLLSEGGLIGLRGNPRTGEPINQYRIYKQGGIGRTFEPYRSHPGGNGLFYAVLDALLPSRQGGYIALFHALAAALTSGLLTSGIVVAWRHFGRSAATVLAVGTLLSQWVLVFGRNLFWSLWALYLPLVAAAWCVRRKPVLTTVFAAGFSAFAMKVAFTGFEYVTTILIAGVTPWIDAALAHGEGRDVLRRAAVFTAGMGAALVAGLGVLVVQNGVQSGSWWTGVSHIILSFSKRTHGGPAAHELIFRESLSAPLLDVLQPYFMRLGPFGLGGKPWVSYGSWALIVLVVCAVALWLRRGQRTPEALRYRALLCATAVSILAPLSWFVLFKGHSYIHTHMNAIVWHLPFVPLSLLCMGQALSTIAGAFRPERTP